MTRVDAVDGTIYIDGLLIEARTVKIQMTENPCEELTSMDGSRITIQGTPTYTVNIDGKWIPDPEIYFWKDVEAYLASQQYQINELELP